MIVRPPETAHPGHERPARDDARPERLPTDVPPHVLEMLRRGREDPRRPRALRGGPARLGRATAPRAGTRSRPRRSSSARGRARPSCSEAAAHFELGQHLHRAGDVDAARAHCREAHRLDPDNWTYKRQAWNFEDPLQGPTEHYDSDWLSDVKTSGAENYYPLPDL